VQLNLDIGGFNPRKLETGCDGLRVRIFAKVHSRFEGLVGRFVWIVLGEILSRILLGEGSLKMFERIRVEKIIWVVWFAWWVMWKMYLSKYELVKEILGLKREPKKPKIVKRRRPIDTQSQLASSSETLK